MGIPMKSAACLLLCALALTGCGGDDAEGGSGGSAGAGTGGDSGMGGDSGAGAMGGTGGDSGTGGTGGDSGTGGDDTDAGMIDPDSGVDGAMQVVCERGDQDNDGDGVCSPECAQIACVNGTCDDTSGTAVCTCDVLYEGAACDDLTPPPQEGLVLWLDAQNVDTLELVGAGLIKRVARWESVLDANVAFVQETITAQPARPNNGVNGLPAVRFDGVDHYMELADFAGLTNAAGYDVYFIGTSTNDTESGAILAGVNGETGTMGEGMHGLLIEANATGNGLRFNHRMPFAASGGVNITPGTDLDLLVALPYRFVASTTNGNLLIQRDNMQVGTATGDVLVFNRDLDLTLGRLSGTQDMRHFKGNIGELLVYAGTKNSVESLKVRNYLKAHWPLIQ